MNKTTGPAPLPKPIEAQPMTKTFILRIEEINYFSIKVEAETAEKAEEIAGEDLGQFDTFDDNCDWRVTNTEEEES